MRVLVTGARGFVGQHICARMAAEGYALTCSSRTTAAIPGLAGVAQIRQVANEAFEDKPDWSAALADVDMIIHLAGRVHVSPGASLEQTRLFDSINVQGTRQLARQAVAAGVKRFIYVSTVRYLAGETNEIRLVMSYLLMKIARPLHRIPTPPASTLPRPRFCRLPSRRGSRS